MTKLPPFSRVKYWLSFMLFEEPSPKVGHFDFGFLSIIGMMFFSVFNFLVAVFGFFEVFARFGLIAFFGYFVFVNIATLEVVHFWKDRP